MKFEDLIAFLETKMSMSQFTSLCSSDPSLMLEDLQPSGSLPKPSSPRMKAN